MPQKLFICKDVFIHVFVKYNQFNVILNETKQPHFWWLMSVHINVILKNTCGLQQILNLNGFDRFLGVGSFSQIFENCCLYFLLINICCKKIWDRRDASADLGSIPVPTGSSQPSATPVLGVQHPFWSSLSARYACGSFEVQPVL